jgi:xanthine dehydrogenase accessory factor
LNSEIFGELRASIEAERPVVVATIVAGAGLGNQLLIWPAEQTLGDLGTPRLNQRAALAAEKAFQSFASRRKTFEHQGEPVEIFFDVHAPSPKLVIVGAVHVAIHLIELAKTLGFRTIVIDPRTAFATPERFAGAGRLIADWPQQALADEPLNESTYFVTLSHDFKIDLPALEIALASPARYVGALGSSRTHAKRVAELLERGLGQEQIDRIHAPIGLDLGGRRAEEIALAIAAEMIAARHGKRF